ncbi:DUF4982 domain-containing protein [Echinicola marina]|uniref:DUF4982 domain-containing protein n=1 Tax=Echinicola marina TaxID=2859768 RepID=UPI001CF6C49F|nr:DUF4982 domain-containing protein [Echinicola marina]UCS91646.1 DUF4982 domain-containing protein [Echinicola marina]
MKFKLLLLIGEILLFHCVQAQRTTYNFNSNWKVEVGNPEGAENPKFNDRQWKEVTLPYAWNEDEAFKVDIHSMSTGIAWYRKNFVLPKGTEGKKVFLEFEGVRQGGEFYINGIHIGRHENGAMAVGFDVSDLLKPSPATNIIAVRTDNDWDYREKSTGTKFQWSDRNFNVNYGGIPKNVYLHITDKLYQTLPLYANLGTEGVYIYAQDINIREGSASITANSQIRNEYASAKTFQYQVDIKEKNGSLLKSFGSTPTTLSPGQTDYIFASAKVEGLHFWSWGYGYLYDVYTKLLVDGEVIDEVKTTTGFRKTDFKNGMVYLNDRVLQIKGYAQRTSNEWPGVGLSVPAWLSDFSNRMMVEGNANLVRWMHITPWKQDIASCDRVGLIQAMPAGDAESDVQDNRWEQRKNLMREAIIYNRNNPSILFYECGNDNISEEHMSEMKQIRDTYDPYGGRAIGSREMLDSKVAEYGGEMLYINKSADQPMWATEYSRDEGLRKYWDEYTPPYHKDGDGPLYKGKNASAYNRNQDSHAIENIIRWYDYFRERPGTGRRVSSGGVNIIFSDTQTHFRGAENYRRSGEVDPMRIPKDGFYAHQVMWDGWVDPENSRTHIIGHWNYEKGVEKPIYVVSNAEEVELFINNRSLGKGVQSHRFLFTFKDVAWRPGSIKAVSYNENGEAVSEDEILTAGEPKSLKLSLIQRPEGMIANGHDLGLIQVEVVDEEGNRCPTALDMIKFELNGPAEWRGGIAQGPEDNYVLSQKLPVEGGVNRVFVRACEEAGEISISASAEGLESASLKWFSKPYLVEKGLSKSLPGQGLDSYLGRGPTPQGTSVQPSRIAVEVMAAKTQENTETVENSFDDNELTSWKNDGERSSGWIEYELEREAELSEITMKLSNWRNRSYPISISIDGQEVYSGNTPKSLGYVTLKFPPTKGKKVLIKLIGANIDGDAFGIVEITGKVEPSGEEKKSKGSLNIVEIEFYETLTKNE